MVITRRQALRSSAFALGGAVVDPQFAKAETTASKPPGQNAGIYRLRLGAFEITVLSDGSFTLPSPLLATNLAEAELKEFVKANHRCRHLPYPDQCRSGEHRGPKSADRRRRGRLAATHDRPSHGQSPGRRDRAGHR